MPADRASKRTKLAIPGVEHIRRSAKRPKNTPAPDPDLPSKTLEPAHAQWLEQYKTVYCSRVTVKGTRTDPATDWVKDNITQPFINEFFPQLTPDQKARFTILIWRSLYNWLNNNTSKPDQIAKKNSTIARFCTQWVWAADYKDHVDQEWRKNCNGNASLLQNIGARRSFVLKLFQSQPPEVKRTYKEKCADMKAKSKLRGELDAESTEEVMKDALRRLAALGRELENSAGLYLVASVAGRVGNMMQVKQAGSPLGLAFLDGPAGRKSGALLGDWLLEHEDHCADGGDPGPAVCPSSFENQHPVIPDAEADEIVLALGRSLVRTYWTAMWQREGGAGRVPYSEIEKESQRWVDPARCPLGVPFQDPARMLLTHALAWIKHLQGWQVRNVLQENLFFFKRILTSGLDDYPRCPEASERTETERNGKPVWLVTYSNYVEAPQNSKPISYPPASWSYFYYLQSGHGPSDPSVGPNHWNGLPSWSEDEIVHSNARFGTDEFELTAAWFKDCDEARDLINHLMEAVNVMGDKIPLSTDLGIWERGAGEPHELPLLLPYLAPGDLSGAGLAYLSEFWMPFEYSLLFNQTDPKNTLGYLETWLDKALTNRPSYHLRSKTLVGGKNGVIWIIRSLIRCLASIGAILPSIPVSAPTPPPAKYDDTRIATNDWTRAILWCNMWLSALTQSNITLGTSCDERRKPEEEILPEAADEPAAGSSNIHLPLIRSGTEDAGVNDQMDWETTNTQASEHVPNPASQLDKSTTTKPGQGPGPDPKGKKKAPSGGKRRGKGGATADLPTEMQGWSDEVEPEEVVQVEAEEDQEQQREEEDAWASQEAIVPIGHYEAELKATRAMSTRKAPALKVFIEHELDASGVIWTPGTCKPIFDPVGTGELPSWDTPRHALTEHIESVTIPVCTAGADTINQLFHYFIEDVASLVQEWLIDGKACKTTYTKKILKDSITRARQSAIDYPHLDQAIWQHAFHYERCRALWTETVGTQYGEFKLFFGKGSGLLARLYDIGQEGPNGGVRKKTITKAQVRVTQMKIYWAQVEALLELATSWANKHQECWLWARESWTLHDKVRIVEDLVQWQAEAAALIDRLDRESAGEWAQAGFSEEIRPVRAWFSFGNPMDYAVDDAAKKLEQRKITEKALNSTVVPQPEPDAATPTKQARPRPRPVTRPPPPLEVVSPPPPGVAPPTPLEVAPRLPPRDPASANQADASSIESGDVQPVQDVARASTHSTSPPFGDAPIHQPGDQPVEQSVKGLAPEGDTEARSSTTAMDTPQVANSEREVQVQPLTESTSEFRAGTEESARDSELGAANLGNQSTQQGEKIGSKAGLAASPEATKKKGKATATRATLDKAGGSGRQTRKTAAEAAAAGKAIVDNISGPLFESRRVEVELDSDQDTIGGSESRDGRHVVKAHEARKKGGVQGE
ncbi:hypothetical protein BDV93DRAFT_516423 [Ceratobasidium sp. AG-I]|nr:hypothetical protein BDV93DRAFT_516423 [Ceratobasidium sp. AG-I]